LRTLVWKFESWVEVRRIYFSFVRSGVLLAIWKRGSQWCVTQIRICEICVAPLPPSESSLCIKWDIILTDYGKLVVHSLKR